MKRARAFLAGFGLSELLVGAMILSLFLGSLALTSRSMLRLGRTGDPRAQVQELGATALAQIRGDLRRSGAHGSYPYLFDGGAASAPFTAHAHAPAVEHAVPGDADHGPDREVVFRLPADDDGDGEPDLDRSGALRWSTPEIGYALVTAADGVNQLERRVDGRPERVVARHVERVLFDDARSAPGEVPLGALRVRLWFRLPDGEGGAYRHRIEALTRLRN